MRSKFRRKYHDTNRKSQIDSKNSFRTVLFSQQKKRKHSGSNMPWLSAAEAPLSQVSVVDELWAEGPRELVNKRRPQNSRVAYTASGVKNSQLDFFSLIAGHCQIIF